MILQRLAEHYDRIAQDPTSELAPPGYSRQKISFCIVLNPDGTLNQFEPLLEQDGKRKRAKSMIVPGQSKPTGQGLNPCILWDNAEYLLGYTVDETRKERAAKAFEKSREMHLALESAINHPSYAAVCRFLRSWSQEDALAHADLEEKCSNFGVYRVAGSTKYVHEEVSLPQETAEGDVAENDLTAMCLVSGEIDQVARLHEPKIKGVADAQSSGALLVSFNAPAFTSYARDQSFNAPVSQEIVFKYANALNHLLDTGKLRLGDMTVVYWAEHVSIVDDLFSALFSGTPQEEDDVKPTENTLRTAQVKRLLDQLRDGTEITAVDFGERDTRFFILGLSPNASRLSVRLWVETDVTEMLKQLRAHVKDFALKGGFNDLPAPLWRVALATGRAEFDNKGTRKSYDSKSISPKLAGDLARSVLTGAAYPQSLLATMIRRIFSDGDIDSVRVSAIKACLLRNTRHTANPLEIPMELDTDTADIAYRCGRLFAILEKAQIDSADGDLNVTIKDRYFSSACVTPGVVMPRLILLNNHHLRKLSVGSKIYYDRMMGEVTSGTFNFPRRLSLADQGKFIIGYFQQRQALYARKADNSEEAA